MGVCKYLDLSTSHLSAMGRLFLANPEKFEKEGEVVVCPKSYGWIILYWENVYGKGIPACLQDIFRLADKENCNLVVLDRDADVLPSLPTYSWYLCWAIRIGAQHFFASPLSRTGDEFPTNPTALRASPRDSPRH